MPELCPTAWKTQRKAPHSTHRRLWAPSAEVSVWHSQRCSKGSECSTTPEDGCGFESEAAFWTEQDTAWTASLKPQRSFTAVLQSTNKIQSIIKSVKLQSSQESSNNDGSQAIPLFKNQTSRHTQILSIEETNTVPLLAYNLFSYFHIPFMNCWKCPCFGLWLSSYYFIGLTWFSQLNSKCMRSWNISRSSCL